MATWLATAASLVALLWFAGLSGNECDVLPAAKQFVDPDWLPQDWYLNLPIGYRYAFNAPVGLALKYWGFLPVAVIGRVVIFAFFAAAAVSLCLAFEVSLWLCLPWVYVFARDQDLVAYEWILKALETKACAYVAAMFALAALARSRYAAMSAWLGVALSFHLLVGVYASLCTLACLVLAPHRAAFRELVRGSWPGVLTGAPGLTALARYALGRGEVDGEIARRGAELYVLFRVPHHVLPSTWRDPSWKTWLITAAAGFLALRFAKSPRLRALAQYCLGAIALFCVGLVLADMQRIAALRFYWFRFADTMLPLLGWFTLALLLSALARMAASSKSVVWLLVGGVLRASMVALSVAAALVIWAPYFITKPTRLLTQDLRPRRFEMPELRLSPMSRWIREHTERGARFAIDPRLENFYVETERSPLVTFKHSPQSEADVVEWYARLKRLNGGRDPRGGGFGALSEIALRFATLSPAQITDLARDYRLDYLLTSAPALPFPRVHQERGQTLYRIGQTATLRVTR